MKTIAILSILSILSISSAQKAFLLEPINRDQVKIYEASLNSTYLGKFGRRVDQDYFVGANEDYSYQPDVFIRKNDPFFPKQHVSYFFTGKDSSLLVTEHRWDIMEYIEDLKTDSHIIEDQLIRKSEYEEKYNLLKTELLSQLGNPINVLESEDGLGLNYKSMWRKDSTEVLLSLIFTSELHNVQGLKLGSFEISLKINYQVPPPIKNEKIEPKKQVSIVD